MNNTYTPVSHRQRKIRNRIILYLVFLVALVVFMATIGIKLLLGLSLFIASTNKNVSISQTQTDSNLLLPPTIYDLPDATNSATVKFSGTATTNTTLTLYVNNKKDKEIPVKDNAFTSQTTLQKGSNQIYLVSLDTKSKETKQSQKYIVSYLADKPKLDISSPHDGDKVSKKEITIQGSTDKDITITINSSPVVVDANQHFSYTMQLNDGDNTISIQAEDFAGNIETKQIKVTYQKED